MSDEVSEIWLPVEGYPGYEVSNLGRFRSYWTPKGLQQTPKIKSVVFNNGRMKVNVKTPEGNTLVIFARLVARAFLGEPNGRIVIPENGDHRDCRASNLRYIDREELGYQIRLKRYLFYGEDSTMGRRMNAQRKHQSQLDRALEVKRLREEKKMYYWEIAQELGISESGACRIYKGLNNQVLEKALKSKLES